MNNLSLFSAPYAWFSTQILSWLLFLYLLFRNV